jgi:hypothetical protein
MTAKTKGSDMKKPTRLTRPAFRGFALALVITALSGYVAKATPYATCLTNNGDGSVSFRLNQTTTTNDTAWVISGGVTNQLQTPGGPVLTRGLITTDTNLFLIPSGAVFQVRIKHTGSGVITTNSPTVAFNSPRGIAVNNNPTSPYFGWVYVGNSAAGTKGDGMFAFTSDLFDILGQGAVAKTGGYNFGTGGTSAPYHTSVAPDDSVLVTDWSDASGNVISMPPDLSSFTYLLKQLTGTAATPVGAANNHGSVISAFIVGTGADRKLYTMDEDYQTDPTATAVTELNSAWEYDIGNGPLPWTAAPNRKIMTPYLATFSGQQQKCEVYGHYLYSNQRRSNYPQHSAYITDLNNLKDPSTYNPSVTPWDTIWTSQDESLAEGYSDDVLRDTMTISVSPDQKWFAAIIASGPGYDITAPDGSTFQPVANDIIVIPMTNGIPNLPGRQVFHFGGPLFGRDLAFDKAHNLYCISSGLGYMQSLDIGETTDITTGSDGSYNLATPATSATVAATTPVAQEAGAVPGVFTITRTPEDIGNPVTVFYSISGTAVAGTNYVAITNGSVIIPSGQTTANVLVTPIEDNTPNPVLTVTMTLRGSGGYSIGFPSSATVSIADDSTPQLHITGLSTNLFEGNPLDYAAITIQRWGNTNQPVTLDTSSFAFGGAAVLNVDYYLTNLPHTISAGVINDTFPLIYAKRNLTGVGSRSILVTNLAGAGYTVVSNSAATTLTLEALPAETVLYSDNFEADTTSDWKVAFQSYTNGSTDFAVDFNFDYTQNAGQYNLPPIPPAPHSTNSDTHGLYMTVNKNAGISAGLNLYLKNHTFSHNYALRFDLFLVENSSGTTQSKNENVLFGINHDGNHTNWFRNSVTGTSLPGSPTESDGLFFDIGADGNGGAGAPYDFAAWSGPTWTNTVNVLGPTNFLAVLASSTRQIFKRPPFESGTSFGGDPANQVVFGPFPSPTWVEVEISQQETPFGNFIAYKINNTVIMSYYNTSAIHVNTNDVSGTVMVGYCDPWDDIANGSGGSGEGSAIIDNLQVVQLSNLPVIAGGPADALADVGGSATFSVTASTATGVTNYQWYLNGAAITNATGQSLTVNPVLAASFGSYSVAVNDGAYSSWSTNATLKPASGPVIITPPGNLAAVVGGSPVFSVTAGTSSGVTNYQWTYYATNLTSASATTKSLTLTNVQAASFGGPYAVIVSDGFNSITSTPAATLTLATQPSITLPGFAGTNFSLSYGSQVGPAYVVDFKTNLADAAWKPLKTNNGTGGIINVTVATNTVSGFYRVRLQ